MAEFQRKPIPFLHRGMNWNAPVEKLQDGQIVYGKNIRVLEQGTISTAHGFTLAFDNFPGEVINDPNTGFVGSYIHSMARLNVLTDFSQDQTRFRRTYVMGMDHALYVFQDEQTLVQTPLLNPVATPLGNSFLPGGTGTGFSGNPWSIIDAQPAGSGAAWKYIGDSQQMVTVGYYPTDNGNPASSNPLTMARALTIGLPVPVNITPVINTSLTTNPAAAHQLFGAYQWAFAYRRVPTGARSNPSAATRYSLQDNAQSLQNPATTPGLTTHWSAVMNVPQPPADPQTGLPDTNVVIDVYRFGGAVLRWALVGSVTWNNHPSGVTDPSANPYQNPTPVDQGPNTFTDNTPDIDLLTALGPPQITDPTTGLTRYNMYQPFVTQDIPKSGKATVTQATWNFSTELIFQSPTAPQNMTGWNVNWLPGSTINLKTESGKPIASFTIYQIRDANRLELMEDAYTTKQLTEGETVLWEVPGGTLQSGQPLAHLFGPYGIGFSGSYVFACGDLNSPGTLYWTNGNDPDSTDVVNNIQVTSPSERLTTGCIYAGQPFTWSTERMFSITPSLTVMGQFTSQEQAGAKGCWLEWSLSVQSNGFADQSVTWRGKDGLYDLSAAAGLQRISDPLYAFFPHDGSTPLAPETILPFLNNVNAENIGQLDDTQPQFHRLTWFQGLLFYDFVAQKSQGFNIFSTLVYDTVNAHGWISLDQPFESTEFPVSRAVMIGANDLNPAIRDDSSVGAVPSPGPQQGDHLGPAARGGDLMVSWGGNVYHYFGFDRPPNFFCRVITRAEDMGDPRALKLFGDFWVNATLVDDTNFFPLVNFHQCAVASDPQPVPGSHFASCNNPVTNLPPATPGPVNVTRQLYKIDFADFFNSGGKGLLQNTLGLDIQWTASSGQYVNTLNDWQPSFIVKPETISFRISDRDDQGRLACKYLRGANIEANTFNQPIPIDFLIDGTTIETITIQHDFQSEHPYGFKTPLAGYEFQVVASIPSTPNWQLFKLAWIWDAWPDEVAIKSAFTDLGDPGEKFLNGFVAPIETGGKPATYSLYADDTNAKSVWIKQTLPLIKTSQVFDLSEPIIAHQFQLTRETPSRVWDAEIKWIWSPLPENTFTWQTEPGTWGFCRWWWIREAYLGLMGGSGTPTLVIQDDFETVRIPLDPLVSNQYQKVYRVLPPMKSKWKSFRIESPGGVRVFASDCCVFAKEWGSDGPFIALHPFGGDSNTSQSASGAKV